MKKQTRMIRRVLWAVPVLLVVAIGLLYVATRSPRRQQPGTSEGEQTFVTRSPESNSPSSSDPPKNSAPQTPDDPKNAPKQVSIRNATKKEHVYRLLTTPNDPGYSASWALTNTNATASWNVSTGNGQVVVADIDSGYALDHEDLASQWYTNDGETGSTQSGDVCWTGVSQNKQTNGCDDDQNGYVDDWRGWDFSSLTNDPQAGQTNASGQGVSHGTEVAGLIGAAGNNGKGITTLSWDTKLMPLQALDDNGYGTTSEVAAAIYYAVDNGADVINMSLGTDEFDQTLSGAVDYAYDHDVVVVAAAGNCGTGTETGCSGLPAGTMSYPALLPKVISVGAVTQSNQRASFSSYGESLDVVAPGSGSIVSPTWRSYNQTSLYASSLYGTSFASPQVASLASLIKSIRPTTNVEDIRALLLATSTKISYMNGVFYSFQYGHGIVNAGSALSVAQSLNATSVTPTLSQLGSSVAEHLYTPGSALTSGCNVSAGSYCTVWFDGTNGRHSRYLPYTQANGSGLTNFSWSGAGLSGYSWQLRARQGEQVSDTPYLLQQK